MVDQISRDLRYALRTLWRDKGFAGTVVLTLAACVGVNAAIFAIIHSVLLNPIRVPEPSAIVLMSNRYPKAGAGDSTMSAIGDYFDRRRGVTALSESALFHTVDHTIELQGTPQRVAGMAATPSLFPLLRVNPMRGRTFTEAEGEEGAQYKVILSSGLYRQLYGDDPSALGRDVRLDGRQYTIVGVMPPDFTFVDPDVRFWIPTAFSAEEKVQHHNNNWFSIGRLKSGATIAQVQSQVDAINAANLNLYPALKELLINAGFRTGVEPLEQMLVKDVRGALYLLWGGSFFVLLIGIVNIANLALARLSTRRREIATRLALGGGRVQLMRQFVTENLLLASIGGAAGLLLAMAILRTLGAFGLATYTRFTAATIDLSVVLTVVAIVVVTALLIGLVPLAELFQTDLNQVLRQDTRGTAGGTRSRRVRQVLVAAQVGLAFVLLVAAGLLLTSFRNLLAIDPGFQSGGVLTASVNAPSSRYSNSKELQSLMRRSLAAIRELPGVTAAGATDSIPLSGHSSSSVIFAEGYVMKPGESVISPYRLRTTPGFMEAMNIKLLRGRYFEERDNETGPKVVIIDERLANHYWPGGDPIGKRMFTPDDEKDLMRSGPDTKWITVVGVVRSIRMEELTGSSGEMGAYYFPYKQDESRSFGYAVKSTLPPDTLARGIRAAIAGIDPGLAIFDVRSMRDRTELSLASRRTSMTLALMFGALALFLSAIGIYGVLAYLVTQRSREIGIRIALGSTRAGVANLVLREGISVVGSGLVVGLIGAVVLRRLVEREVYGVRALDPMVLGLVAVALGSIALLACLQPARRAANVDPVTILSEY